MRLFLNCVFGLRYICLVAKSGMLKEEIEPVQVKDRSLLIAMLRNLYPTAISIGITDNPSERGIYGAMNMDTTGRFIPTLSILESGKKRRKRPQGCAYFSNLSVLPNARRRGIGTSLIREAERLAKKYGCWGAALHCSPDNREAFRLYTKEGYLTVEGAQSEKNNCILLAKVF